jgi:uncharacterized membrane protein YgcG
MVRFLTAMVALMVAMFTVPALAFDPPPAPAVGSIVDQANVLKPVAIQKLNAQLRQVNQSTGNQIGILIVPSLNGENIRDVGYATAKAWKVGQAGVDNGVMIVWSRGDRQVGIETGKGIEGDLPDLKCNDIIRNVIAPKFKADYPGHFYDGLSQGIAAINTAIGDHRAAVAEQKQHDAQRLADNGGAAPITNGGAPQTTTTQSGGCDVSGTQHAGVGGAVVWLALIFGGLWLVRRQFRKMAEQSDRQRQAQLEQLQRSRQAELDRLNADQLAHAQAERDRLQAIPNEVQGIPVVVVDSPAPVQDPLATATTDTPTANVAERIRQEQCGTTDPNKGN